MAEHTDELRALRARAYGPEADIQDDPVALQRLRDLEALERAMHPAAATTAAPAVDPLDVAQPSSADAVEPDEPTADSSETPAPEAAEAATPEAAPIPWWRRRMPLLWAGSLIAAALLGGAAALSFQAIAAGRVAVLTEDATGTWPENFFGEQQEGARLFDEFHGLTVVTMPEQFGPSSGTVCMYVIARPTNSMATAGCTAGAFPAVASLMVEPNSPEALLERYAEGTELQFVLDGSQVTVYAATH